MTRRYLTALVVCLGTLTSMATPRAASAQTFTNATPITIPGSGAAAPYPSNIPVAGLSAPIARVAVTLHEFSHTFPDDVDILLVAPDGGKLVLFSDAGGSNVLSGATITLSDDASTQPADAGIVPTGAYRPANFGTVIDPLPAPAPAFAVADSPAPGGAATFASQFGGHSGNGTWSLYVVDDAAGDVGSIAGGWSITFYQLTVPTAGQLIISELRSRGPAGAQDEFIKIYNASGGTHVVSATSGTGYGIAASDGVTRCSIPNGTIIPQHGHYLCVNSATYSLGAYAAGDATYTTDIPDNAGIAIFNNDTGGGSYSLANRLDAVGTTSEANTTYKEGAGLPALTPFSIDSAWVRKHSGGCIGSANPPSGNCTTLAQISGTGGPTGADVDTNTNSNDFIFVDTNGTSAGGGQRLGAPGPENSTSPIHLEGGANIAPLDVCDTGYTVPNRVRDFTSDPANNSTFGTLDLRRRFTNTSGGSITRLRFRVLDITTFPSISGVSDLRPRTSGSVVVTVDRPPCGSGTSNSTVQGTALEQPPSQPNGGGFNSTMSVGTVSPGTPLANGATVDFHFLLGIQQTGLARFCVMTETLPATPSSIYCYIGSTESGISVLRPRSSDYNGDTSADIAVFRPSTGQWYLQSTGQVVLWGQAGDIPVPGDYNGDGTTDAAVFRPSTGQWFLRNIGTVAWGIAADIPVPGDYDGDGVTDIAVYRPGTGQWFVHNVGTFNYGGPGYLPVPADYDADGTDDIAVYAPATATWYAMGLFTIPWGLPGDQAVPGDYNADGFADIAVYRPSNSTWYVRNLNTVQYGAIGDIPVPGDFNADGQTDIAVYRPSTGQWFVRNQFAIGYGNPGDIPLPGHPQVRTPSRSDIDGDRLKDLMVFRPSSSTWYTRLSSTGSMSAIMWGQAGDVPVPGDYDGDGYTDPTVFRPSTGFWYAARSGTGYSTYIQVQWGMSGDIPVTADFDGDGISDIGVFRPSTGFWYVKLSSTGFSTFTQRQWGASGDVPKPGDYDGDGLADFAVYRPSTGYSYVLQSTSGFTTSVTRLWGSPGDVSAFADFDGDGRLDIAVFRPSTGDWWVLTSGSGFTFATTRNWGGLNDVPMPGDYDGDGRADFGIYSPSTGQWWVLLSSAGFTTWMNVQWGNPGDAPL